MTWLALARLVRAPLPAVLRTLTLSAAVALLASMLLFVGHSLQTMTAGAVRQVPLDWQAPVDSAAAAGHAASSVALQPDVAAAAPVATAPFSGIERRGSSGIVRAGAGAVLAVPAKYPSRLRTFRLLRGTLSPNGIVLDQQLAATLQAQPGDQVRLSPRPGARAQSFRVSGVALVSSADVLFQPLIPLIGPAPRQPPGNIAIVPLAAFEQRLAPLLPPANASTTSSAAPGTLSGVQWQVQAQVDPRTLSGSPAHAVRRADQIRNRVERSLPGQVQFVDNLSDALTSAAGDALYAQTLYIMLAVPGALIAIGLAYLAALGTADRDRRELALLRARGASRRELLQLAVAEACVIGVVAGFLSTVLALLAVHLVGGGGGVGAFRVATTFGICTVLAVVGAFAARLAATAGALRSSVTEGRRVQGRERPPLWQRLWLDLIALGVAGLIYWLTARTGFSAVVNPDSNPTLSLSVYMFLAPALLWIGATLLLLRLRGRAFGWLAARAVSGRASTWGRFLLTSAGRRGAAINRGLVLVGLLLAFGVELGVFTATYDQQARVDAQLTLGADVVVTGAPARHAAIEAALARVSGVAGTTGVDHSYAYVGPDLQDTFGIDPATLTRATSLRNSYFLGGGAGQMLDRLRTRPDGILVSRETITDYALGLGDLLKLRVFDHASRRFRVVPFHVVGIVQEFPSAPRDSFMVANRDYLQRASHDPGPNVFFVRTTGNPRTIARTIAARTRSLGTAVQDIRTQTAQTVSSITTVDLAGISRIEELFAVAIAVAATALFTAVSLVERRREFATMAALGTSLRRVSSFLWSEAAIVVVFGAALAALLGWLLAEMLIAMLQHVFDPPPDHLAAPWGFLGVLAAAAIGGSLLAGLIASMAIRRLNLGAVLREE